MSCLLGPECATPEGLKCKEPCCDHFQPFVLKHNGLFLHTDIDSGGMTAYLVKDRNQADQWDTRADAENFGKRCAERFSETPLTAVQL
jgi:hypothetical protein